MKSLNFENWSSGELSKIGHHLKVIDFIKNLINKKCAPKFVILNEKQIQKDSDDF